jgi:hypothetical protein
MHLMPSSDGRLVSHPDQAVIGESVPLQIPHLVAHGASHPMPMMVCHFPPTTSMDQTKALVKTPMAVRPWTNLSATKDSTEVIRAVMTPTVPQTRAMGPSVAWMNQFMALIMTGLSWHGQFFDQYLQNIQLLKVLAV